MSLWGEIALDGARRSVIVERAYPATPGELWSALTEPDRLARWVGVVSGTRDSFRLELGGRDQDATVAGRVLACDPERRLVVSWRFEGAGQREADTELEVVIEPGGDAHTVLRLTHRRVQAVTASVYGAGWQDVLTHLSRELGASASPEEHDGYLGGAADPAAFDAALAEYRTAEAALVAGEAQRIDGLSGVRLRRVLDAPRADVWDALTLPDRVGRWLWPVLAWPDDPTRARALRPGDLLRLGDENVEGGVQELEVLEAEPGRLLRLTWGTASVAFRLDDGDDDRTTVLTLVQDPIEEIFGAGRLRSAPDFAAGWHTLVDQLTLLLAGLTVPEPGRLWEAAYQVYADD